MSKYCPTCKKEFDGGKFCLECGSPLVEVVYRNFCPTCNKIVENGRFCIDCGSPIVARKYVDDSPIDDGSASIEFFVDDRSDEEILANYMTAVRDLRDLNDEELPQAIKDITRIADKGNPDAEVLLSELILEGRVEGDVDKMYALWCDAEKKGAKQGTLGRALAYYYGISVDADDKEAERLLDKVLDIPQALYYKGKIYEDRGDDVEAVKWYKQAADKGHWGGLLNTGHIYLRGSGTVEQDPVKAFQYYTEAASKGVAEAEFYLGLCYRDGIGTDPDETQARFWFQESASHGDKNGLFTLAEAYERGSLGVAKDKGKAIELYEKSAELGDSKSMFALGDLYSFDSATIAKAIKWYQKAADNGEGDALYELATYYEKGEGVEKDPQKAEELYSEALEAGSELALQRQKMLVKQERDLQQKQEEERIEKEQKAQREREEKERREREEAAARERKIMEAEAKAKAEAEAKAAAEKARHDAEVKALAAEQKQKELEAQLARQQTEEQERQKKEAKRKKRRRTFWILFLLFLGLLTYFGLFLGRDNYNDYEPAEIEEVTPMATPEAAQSPTPEEPIVNNVQIELPSQTRMIGALQSNDGKSYPIEMVLDFYPSSEEGILGNVSGYYFYRKYKETNNIRLSGTVNSAHGLSLLSGEGSEEFIGTIDKDFTIISGAWHQIKNGSVVSNMAFSLSTNEYQEEEESEVYTEE